MKVLYISASNIVHRKCADSTSYKICETIKAELEKRMSNIHHNIIELKNLTIQPCVGCGGCLSTHRCILNDDFNCIYEEVVNSDIIMFVSPHYAPIPAKLSALLEKMEQITFLHWGKDNSYRSEVYGKTTGVISHGGGEEWALKSYKCMVNDTIANALDTIQLKLIPLNDEWNTGISLPLMKVSFHADNIFPHQEYDWESISAEISAYVEIIVTAAKRRV